MKATFLLVFLLFAVNCSAMEPLIEPSVAPRLGCSFQKGSTIPHIISTQIKGGLGAQDCDFYHYAMENFLSQVYWYGKPQVLGWMSVYGVFDGDGNVLKEPAKWGRVPVQALEVCNLEGKPPQVITGLTNQAGNPRPLQDQNGEYTYYDVRMNRTLYDFLIDCDFTDANKCANPAMNPHRLPPGAVEVKIAWKIIDQSQANDFISATGWVKNPETGKCSSELLGVVGYHNSLATDHHPEMTWASFQHRDNAPRCDNGIDEKQWNYFNNDSSQDNNIYVQGEITNVCDVLPHQGANIRNALMVDRLNRGYQRFFEDHLPWSNYDFIGAIWMNEGVMPVLTKEQRGEIKLANPVLETYYQDNLNCFSCHTYQAPNDAMEVTHIGDVVSNKTSLKK